MLLPSFIGCRATPTNRLSFFSLLFNPPCQCCLISFDLSAASLYPSSGARFCLGNHGRHRVSSVDNLKVPDNLLNKLNFKMKRSQFLLTRFNCPGSHAPTNRGINNNWLAHRFLLFEHFCLPSVLSQDIQDFHWIILIDERTSAQWVDPVSYTHLDVYKRQA